MHVIGTAGHVDHGKSTLVAALTGTNPDRWIEERLRGMTLDLGFAHLRFDDGTEAGIVDVPGHERFLHNMLAGAAGMELLLIVVAMNEGVMPQTLEHLAILSYLNVRRSILVLTKSDLLDAPGVDAARRSIASDLEGTIAQHAPTIAVSATTGAGLAELLASIRNELHELPERSLDEPVYLPVDRVFALPGHGTIVTGTLLQGAVTVGDTLTVFPEGRAVRVRSLQVFGESRKRATAGSRVALNLPGIETRDVVRGNLLADSQFRAHEAFSVTVSVRSGLGSSFRRRTPVRAYIGAAEILGTLVFDVPPVDAQHSRASIFLRRSIAVYPEMPCVLRRLSPKTLLGGGTIRSPLGGATAALSVGTNSNETLVVSAIRDRPRQAQTASDLSRAANLREEAVAVALEALLARGEVVYVRRPDAYLDAPAAESLLEGVAAFLAQQLAAEPWAMGVTSLALSRALGLDETLLVRLLAVWSEDGRLANRAGYYAPPEFAPQLSPEQKQFFESCVPSDPANPFAPAALGDVLDAAKTSGVRGVSKAFDTLLARGALVKIADSLYRGTQIAQIHARLHDFLLERERITMAEFRDLIATSRKYAVPLLEWFDMRGITVRAGDFRSLRSNAGRDKEPPTAV